MTRHEIKLGDSGSWACVATGEIKGERRLSGGGGQYRTYQEQEFWVVTQEGEEHRVSFRDQNIAIRDGQRATLLWGSSSKKNEGPLLIIRNNSTGNYWWLVSGSALDAEMGVVFRSTWSWEKMLVASVFIVITVALAAILSSTILIVVLGLGITLTLLIMVKSGMGDTKRKNESQVALKSALVSILENAPR